MSGPLPNPKRRRRNPPVIPTTELPVSGRKGRPPKPPETYRLEQAGKAWWKWAWGTPQATAWDSGAFYVIARRAQLEDDLDALDLNDALELVDLLAGADKEAIERVAYALDTLKRAATGKLALEKEMRELDKVLGLTPKAMAELRWKIVAEEKQGEAPTPTKEPTRKRKKGEPDLRVVDTALVG
jgi:hypothetical protein